MKKFIPIAVAATESAAISAMKTAGYGDQILSDKAAVNAMRASLSQAPFAGTVVIGEGERDNAPMLYIGEKVGNPNGEEVEIALDPLEGTAICANFGEGSMSVLAFGPKGSFLHAPDIYMEKIAVGKNLPSGIISLKYTIEQNLHNVAKAKNIPITDLIVVALKRPRHNQLIQIIRKLGARLRLIDDGDVRAIISMLIHNDSDIYIGTGGAPEGVITATALRALGGQMEGKLIFSSNEERERAYEMGINDLDKIYSCSTLVTNDDTTFVATGVTDSQFLPGVNKSSVSSLIITKDTITTSQHNKDQS